MARAKKETTQTTAEKVTAVKAEPVAEVKAAKAETKTAKAEVKTEAKPAKAETKTAKPVKTEAKKAANKSAKETTTKAAKETIKCTIEFGGKNTTIEEIVNTIKENYKAEGGKAAIKTLDVYIQPENGVAYYVVNGSAEGKSINF